MTYFLEQPEVIGLVLFKLEAIQNSISEILKNWGENNIEDFLMKVKKGELVDAVMDAISMKQLQLDLHKYQEILKKLKE